MSEAVEAWFVDWDEAPRAHKRAVAIVNQEIDARMFVILRVGWISRSFSAHTGRHVYTESLVANWLGYASI